MRVAPTTAQRLRIARVKLLVAALLAGTCEPNDTAGPQSAATTPVAPLEAVSTALAVAPTNVLVGAGQIADSTKPNSPFTASLLDTIPGTVFTLGDNAYLDGSATAFTREYDPYWGRQKARTRPAPGNHDYLTSGAAGYFGYFGALAGDSGKGYYSFDLGDWHIVSLNSTTGAGAGSAQDTWLRADLAATTKPCLLAYFHHPRFFSSYSTSVTSPNSYILNFWNVLYAARADLVLNGHFYHYERFAPQNASGALDVANGIREIIVGTGGAGHDATTYLAPNSLVRNSDTYGVLKLTLSAAGAGTYAWAFLPIAGKTFTDSGSATCHRAVTVSPSLSTVAAAQASITAGGAIPVTVTLKDGNGNPVSGATVVLAATGSGNTLTQPASPTDASGVATGTFTSTVAEGKTISATANGTTLASTAAVMVTAGAMSASASTVATTPATIPAGGGPATITVTAMDGNGNPVSGQTVVLAATGSGNTLTQPAAPTNASGVATGTLASTVAERKTISATVNGTALTRTAAVAVTAGAVSASQSTVTAAPASITAGGGPATITVTAKDGNGNLISGATVALAATGSGNTLTQPAAATDVNGVAAGTLSSTVAEGKTVSATVNGTALTPAAAVTVTVTAGAASASQSTTAAAPASILAGAGPATITVTAKDGSGNLITGATVVLAATGSGNTLTQPAVPTDANGVATGTLSSTVAEAKTISATVNGTALTPTAVVTVTAGAVSASLSTLAAAPATIPPGSGVATITVTAKDGNGNLISGATVVLASTGTGNTLTQPATATDGHGVATGTLSSTVAEGKTISATVNGTALTSTGAVTVTAGAVSPTLSAVAAAPTSITAGGALSTITVTAKDGNGNPVAGATAVLAAAGSGNTLTQPAAATDGGGVATGTLSSTVAEGKTVSATVNGTALTATATVTVTAGAVSASQSTVAAAPTSVTAGGAVSTITVIARDGNGNPVRGATVILAATGSTNTLTQPAATTDVNGVATGTLGSTVAEGKTVSATVNGTALTATATVTVTAGAVSASQSTVAAAPASIPVGGGPATITVTAKDRNGNPISGATVVLAATGNGNTLTQPAGPTNASGVATGTLSSTVAEAKTVSATVAGITLAQTAAVTVTVGTVSATQSTVTVAPASISAGGAPATITVTAKDGFGNPISGATAVLAATGSGNTLTQPTAATDVSGVTTGTLGSTVAEGKTISATVNGAALTPTAAVTVTAGAVSATVSIIAAAPTSIPTGGPVTTITVTVKDANANPISGATVVLAATGTGNTLTPPAGPTSASGVATGKLSSTVAEAKTISATVNGTALTPTVTVTVTAAPVASVTVTPAASSIFVGGTQQLTAVLKDANGNQLSGRVLTWATSNGAVATVSGNGLVTGAAAGSATITATSEGQGGTSAISVSAGSLIIDASLVLAEATVPKPTYLVPIAPGPYGLRVTRVGNDPGQTMTLQTGTGTWGTTVRHHYSKDQPWNSDGTLIALQNSSAPTKLYLDGQTYLPKVGRCSGYSGDDRWHPSPLHPHERVNVSNTGTELMWYDVVSCTKTRSWPLPLTVQYFGPSEGNPSLDGRYAALTDAVRWMFVVDMDPQPPFAAYPSQRIGPAADASDCGLSAGCAIDWVSVSPSGRYVVVAYTSTRVRVYDLDPNTLALTPRSMPAVYPNCGGTAVQGFIYDLGHADLTLNPFDNQEDVLVGQEHCHNAGKVVNGLLIGGVVMARLRDGAITPLTDPANEAYPDHISTRNTDRPGWAYVTYYPGVGKRFGDEIIAVKLDGSKQVERYAHTHTDATGCYSCEAQAVPSRDGLRIMWASNWMTNSGATGTATVIQAYIVDTRP